MTDGALQAQLDIGRVVSRAFSAIGANFTTFLVVVAVFATIPSVLISLGLEYFAGTAVINGNLDIGTFALLSFAIGFIASAPGYIGVAAVTHASIVTFNGGKASLGDSIATGVGRMLPLFLLGIASSIGIVLAAFLLIIPALIVAVVISVSAPAMVVEKLGVFGSMSRSSDLTKGNRWRVFWLVVIAFGVTSAIGLVQGSLTAAIGGGPREISSVGLATISFTTTIVSAVAETISTIITSAGIAALYYELRTGKEGTTSDELAKVFD